MGAMAKDARQILMHRLFRGSFRRFIHVGSFLDLPHPGKLSARGTSPARVAGATFPLSFLLDGARMAPLVSSIVD